jgi:hypothetical protein
VSDIQVNVRVTLIRSTQEREGQFLKEGLVGGLFCDTLIREGHALAKHLLTIITANGTYSFSQRVGEILCSRQTVCAIYGDAPRREKQSLRKRACDREILYSPITTVSEILIMAQNI